MNKEKFSVKQHFFHSLFDENPILVQLLGMCPTLATSTSLVNGFGMGVSATAVLILSNLLNHPFRFLHPFRWQYALQLYRSYPYSG